jgi:hypothetical protein
MWWSGPWVQAREKGYAPITWLQGQQKKYRITTSQVQFAASLPGREAVSEPSSFQFAKGHYLSQTRKVFARSLDHSFYRCHSLNTNMKCCSDRINPRWFYRALQVFLHLCRARRIISFDYVAAAVQKLSILNQPQFNLVLLPMKFDLARREWIAA